MLGRSRNRKEFGSSGMDARASGNRWRREIGRSGGMLMRKRADLFIQMREKSEVPRRGDTFMGAVGCRIDRILF